jgi:hypothetical protein
MRETLTFEDPTCRARDEEAAPLSLLVVGEATVQSIALPARGAVVIGRARECDVTIGDASVSRQHARLHVGPLQIEDLGSANGTRLAGRRLSQGERAALAPGDAFTLGTVTLFVQRSRAHASGIEVRTDGYFDGRLAAECARAQKYGLKLALLTLSPGPAAVEAGLLEEALKTEARTGDVVGLGPGREARVLLLHATREVVEGFASRVCERLKGDCEVGLALCPDDAVDPGGLLSSARARRAPFAARPRETSSTLIVVDAATAAVRDRALRLAATDLPVLFTGEDGVGKRTFAAWLHAQSRRSRRALVRIDCRAMAEEPLATELFGIESGDGARGGALEAADGSTLLLENVDALPPSLEARLTHTLEYGQVYRTGGITPRRARVRFVATARRRPEGRDLVRKLAGAVVEVPALRARPEDVESLARSFATGSSLDFALEAIAALRSYPWPGNVAELRLTIERAVALADGGCIDVADLDLPSGSSSADQTLRVDVAALERDRIEAALTASGGNRSRAARALGIARNTLLARLKIYGL